MVMMLLRNSKSKQDEFRNIKIIKYANKKSIINFLIKIFHICLREIATFMSSYNTHEFKNKKSLFKSLLYRILFIFKNNWTLYFNVETTTISYSWKNSRFVTHLLYSVDIYIQIQDTSDFFQ